jgi:hypothetical protein
MKELILAVALPVWACNAIHQPVDEVDNHSLTSSSQILSFNQ